MWFLKVSVTWQIKLNTLYIYLHYAKDHQTWQSGDLKWDASSHKSI